MSSWSFLFSIVVPLVDFGHYIYIFFTSTSSTSFVGSVCTIFATFVSFIKISCITSDLICYVFVIKIYSDWGCAFISYALSVLLKREAHCANIAMVFCIFEVLLFHMVKESVSGTCCGLAFLTNVGIEIRIVKFYSILFKILSLFLFINIIDLWTILFISGHFYEIQFQLLDRFHFFGYTILKPFIRFISINPVYLEKLSLCFAK